jgi:hypothetical protein
MTAEGLVPEIDVRDALHHNPIANMTALLQQKLHAGGPVVGPVTIETEDGELGMITVRARAMVKRAKDAGCMLQEVCGCR